MIEKVTLQMSGNGKFRTENGTGCDAMNPKTLMLYAAAQCSAQTALMIMQKERITPKRFEISYWAIYPPRRFNPKAYTARSMWFTTSNAAPKTTRRRSAAHWN